MGRKRLYADAAARKRAQRARESAARSHRLDAPTPPVVAVVDHADPVGALAAWAASTLIVPPGHPRSGEPMALPEFAVAWLRASWNAHESALSTARKKRKISYRGGPGARLPGGSAAASWLAWGDCEFGQKQGGRITAASCGDRGSVES